MEYVAALLLIAYSYYLSIWLWRPLSTLGRQSVELCALKYGIGANQQGGS